MRVSINGQRFASGDFAKWARLQGQTGTKVELLQRLEIASKLGTFAGITVEKDDGCGTEKQVGCGASRRGV